jgi:hypothetical protein
VASRAREADQYALDGQAGPYYEGPDALSDHYAYNGSNGPITLPYQAQSDFSLGAFGHNLQQASTGTVDQNLPSLRENYQFGAVPSQGAWPMDAGTSGPMNQGERPINFNMQTTRSNDGPLSGGDQHGIEHAAALLSMAYQMHKERKPALEEPSPTDNSLTSRLSLYNAAIDPGLQNQDWTPRATVQARHNIVDTASSSNANSQQHNAYQGQGFLDLGSMATPQNSNGPSDPKIPPTNAYRNGQFSVYTGGEWTGSQIPGVMSGLDSNEMVSLRDVGW